MALRFALGCLAMAMVSGCSGRLEENRLLTRELFESFNSHNWEAMASLYSDSALFLDPSLGTDWVSMSHEQIIAKYRELERAIPDIQDEVIELLPVDNRVVIQFISIGHGSDSSELHLPICTVLTIENGKITRDATYYNQ